MFYNATVHRDRELRGYGGSCEGWRGEKIQHRACCTFGVWQGWREKEELLSKYRNTIPAGKGRAGHGGILQQPPLAVTPVGGTALAPAPCPGGVLTPSLGRTRGWAPTHPRSGFWPWPGTAKPPSSPTLYSFPPPYSQYPPQVQQRCNSIVRKILGLRMSQPSSSAPEQPRGKILGMSGRNTWVPQGAAPSQAVPQGGCTAPVQGFGVRRGLGLAEHIQIRAMLSTMEAQGVSTVGEKYQETPRKTQSEITKK